LFGFAFYRRFAGETGFRAHALQILRVEGGEISEVHVFVLPSCSATSVARQL
jgi:hypothetical protein